MEKCFVILKNLCLEISVVEPKWFIIELYYIYILIIFQSIIKNIHFYKRLWNLMKNNLKFKKTRLSLKEY